MSSEVRCGDLHSIRDARLVSNDWMTVFFNLAIVEAELQHTDAAISLYREAISFFPSYLQAYRQYGSFLLEHGFFTEAEEFLKHAVTLFPNSHQIFFLLGGVRLTLSQFFSFP